MRTKSFTNFTESKENNSSTERWNKILKPLSSKISAGGSKLLAQTEISLIPSFLLELGRNFPMEMHEYPLQLQKTGSAYEQYLSS